MACIKQISLLQVLLNNYLIMESWIENKDDCEISNEKL